MDIWLGVVFGWEWIWDFRGVPVSWAVSSSFRGKVMGFGSELACWRGVLLMES